MQNWVGQYGSSSDEDDQGTLGHHQGALKRPRVDAAPQPSSALAKVAVLPSVTTREMSHNIPYELLSQAVQGPMNPFSKPPVNKNLLTGTYHHHHHRHGLHVPKAQS